MFRELKDCYGKSARNFVRVVVDEETQVMYLTNKKTMIPMLSPSGKPSLYNPCVELKIVNDTSVIGELNQFVGWQNLFINEADGTMYVGGTDILCQLVNKYGTPRVTKVEK